MDKDDTVSHSDVEVKGKLTTNPACESPPYVSCHRVSCHPASAVTKRVVLPFLLILSSVLCAFPTHPMIKAFNFQSSCLIHINHEHVASHMSYEESHVGQALTLNTKCSA